MKGIVKVTVEATDLDDRRYRLVKLITFEEARVAFDMFMRQIAEEWVRDFHGRLDR
jgi:hypothetical protein